ncbi:homoserine kinase [Cytobacillus sp. OWB-43]|uniref:homoserine kinase n=1 Tax=Cytobacillus sp. OWB-43 TaxID=3108468 RepID=UPI002B00248C|nr:homoserine kinase [Cytobacillus sp. OWB-43]MEA1855333.1 homoserine kinase [Cytobacillus sp. OWB-43]
MMAGEMLVIEVPASTANLGPGFDSIGLALNLYLRLEVTTHDQWEVIPLSEGLMTFPTDERNYIIQVAMQTAKKYNQECPPCRLTVSSDIPIARGLGSSAAAIVAGIELADTLCDLRLTKQQKLEWATEIEGHPDNVGASLLGGLLIGSQTDDGVNALSLYHLQVDFVVCIPTSELLTKKSRQVLPTELSYKQAVHAGAIGNVFIASLISGDYEQAGKMMMKDLYHQPYRKEIVPELEGVEKVAMANGALGVALSGAGPTILCLARDGEGQKLATLLSAGLHGMKVVPLQMDLIGSRIYKENSSKIKSDVM